MTLRELDISKFGEHLICMVPSISLTNNTLTGLTPVQWISFGHKDSQIIGTHLAILAISE